MGAHPWFYFSDYETDINSALQKLRQREFLAGRYNPVVRFPEFPVDPEGPAPGAGHHSIENALQAAGADGTRSILDMLTVSAAPDYSAVAPLSTDALLEVFGTEQPSREMLEDNYELFDLLERGKGVYIIVYKDDQPSELFFAGYSFD